MLHPHKFILGVCVSAHVLAETCEDFLMGHLWSDKRRRKQGGKGVTNAEFSPSDKYYIRLWVGNRVVRW